MPCPCESQPLHGQLYNVRLGDTATPPVVLTAEEQQALEVRHDIVAGSVAFATPLLYHYAAPKKWPRLNTWQNIAAVVGLYFTARWLYEAK
jgi:hypothetical protein